MTSHLGVFSTLLSISIYHANSFATTMLLLRVMIQESTHLINKCILMMINTINDVPIPIQVAGTCNNNNILANNALWTTGIVSSSFLLLWLFLLFRLFCGIFVKKRVISDGEVFGFSRSQIVRACESPRTLLCFRAVRSGELLALGRNNKMSLLIVSATLMSRALIVSIKIS